MIRVKGKQEAFCPDSGVLRFCLYYAYIVKIPEAADRVVQRDDRRVVPFFCCSATVTEEAAGRAAAGSRQFKV